MPTGYTADLWEGKVSFQQFTMRCARAFGALIEMREDPPDAPIPDEFHPSDYHLNAIETAKKRLAKVEKWNNARMEREAKKAFDDEVRSIKKRLEDSEKTGWAYISMLKQVGKWVPPTKYHERLKSFMIEQLAESVEFDCLCTPTMPQRLSGKQYHTKLVKSVRWDIAYHTKEHAKIVRCARERSEWVRALRDSLNG